MSANVPLTTAFANGTRVWIGKAPEKALRYEGGQAAGALPRLGAHARRQEAGRRLRRKGQGALGALSASRRTRGTRRRRRLRMLADGAVDFLQRQPKAAVATWPGGHRAAHLVTMNVDEPIENALTLASTLDTLKIKGTFFVLASAAVKSPGTLRRSPSATRSLITATRRRPSRARRRATRCAASRACRRRSPSRCGPTERISGFRAPGEAYDANTEQVLQATGFRYHAVDPNRSDARLPLFAKANRTGPADDIVVLPRTQADDIVFLNNKDVTLNDIITGMRGELALAIEEGALGMVSIHSRNYAKDSLMRRRFPPTSLRSRK
jgi:peptidoglycan/xylan/chitin deacetylase (PgdA/CDA1 family)